MNPEEIKKSLPFIIFAVIMIMILYSGSVGFIFPMLIFIFLFKNLLKKKNFNFSSLINKLNNNPDAEKPDFQKNSGFSESYKSMNKKNVLTVTVVVVLILIIIKAVAIIPAGETGVQHLFGKVKDSELRSGFHLINPLALVTKMSIRTEQYTMSVVQKEGQISGDDSIDALTNEGLKVKLDITVFYHLVEKSASNVFRELGINYEEKIIRPEIRSAIRDIVAGYDSKAIYSDKREEVAKSIGEKLRGNISARGIEIEQVLLRNVILPPKLEGSIQEKLQAEQENQRYDFLLQKEEKEAKRKVIEAEGQRDAQTLINQSLTNSYLNYLYINELKDRQGTIYVPVNPSTGMPMFKGIQ